MKVRHTAPAPDDFVTSLIHADVDGVATVMDGGRTKRLGPTLNAPGPSPSWTGALAPAR